MNLDQFDDVAEGTLATLGQKQTGKYEKMDLKNLRDGEYWFAIRMAELREVPVQRTIVEFTLDVVGSDEFDGRQFKNAYWLNKADGAVDDIAIKRLNEDLKTLGFDVGQWTKENGRPWGAELAKAIVVIRGVGFKGKKVTNTNANGKSFANLYVNERATDDAKPAQFGPQELKAPDDFFAVT